MISPSLSRSELDVLRRLRARFLSGGAGDDGAYWTSPEELALYDRTFAERIGWKWDAVLRELHARHWEPAGTMLVDWGCGSGVASRRVLGAWPGSFRELRLHDHSSLAVEFATASARAAFPELQLVPSLPSNDGKEGVDGNDRGSLAEYTLLVSHVLNELSEEQLAELLALASAAREIIWVESGTFPNSRRLVAEVRERLVGSGEFAVVAPCTHREQCGLFHPRNERHWCHSFARTPGEVYRDAGWIRFGRELGIDLRATPYAFLVLERRTAQQNTNAARVLGRPRDYKGYSKVLSCEARGVYERMLQKRDAPALLKDVQGDPVAPVFVWQLKDEKIIGGERAT